MDNSFETKIAATWAARERKPWWPRIERWLAWLIVAIAVYDVAAGLYFRHAVPAASWVAGAGWYRWLAATKAG